MKIRTRWDEKELDKRSKLITNTKVSDICIFKKDVVEESRMNGRRN